MGRSFVLPLQWPRHRSLFDVLLAAFKRIMLRRWAYTGWMLVWVSWASLAQAQPGPITITKPGDDGQTLGANGNSSLSLPVGRVGLNYSGAIQLSMMRNTRVNAEDYMWVDSFRVLDVSGLPVGMSVLNLGVWQGNDGSGEMATGTLVFGGVPQGTCDSILLYVELDGRGRTMLFSIKCELRITQSKQISGCGFDVVEYAGKTGFYPQALQGYTVGDTINESVRVVFPRDTLFFDSSFAYQVRIDILRFEFNQQTVDGLTINPGGTEDIFFSEGNEPIGACFQIQGVPTHATDSIRLTLKLYGYVRRNGESYTPPNGYWTLPFDYYLRIEPRPAKVCAVSTQPDGKHFNISWNIREQDSAQQLLVYRQTLLGLTAIAKVPATQLSYVDTSSVPAARTERYTVGWLSDTASWGQQVALFAAPRLNAVLKPEGVRLNWSPYEGATVTAYSLWKIKEGEGSFLVGNYSGTTLEAPLVVRPEDGVSYQVRASLDSRCGETDAVSYSNIVPSQASILSPDEARPLQLWPNPVLDGQALKLRFVLDKPEKVKVEIGDYRGGVRTLAETLMGPGTMEESFVLPPTAPGYYYVSVRYGSKMLHSRLAIFR